MSAKFTRSYFSSRRAHVDSTEWYDIFWALRSIGISFSDKIIELGAGEGFLIDFLRRRGYRNVFGVDLLGRGATVFELDLERENPPRADCYVFQHLIEHLRPKRAVELLEYCYRCSKAVVGIVPGHFSADPTHKVSYYTREELMRIVGKINPSYYAIRPDALSYVNPTVRDWLIVMSKRPIKLRAVFFFAGEIRNILRDCCNWLKRLLVC